MIDMINNADVYINYYSFFILIFSTIFFKVISFSDDFTKSSTVLGEA